MRMCESENDPPARRMPVPSTVIETFDIAIGSISSQLDQISVGHCPVATSSSPVAYIVTTMFPSHPVA